MATLLMLSATSTRVPPTGDFAGKAWQQVLARDPSGDGEFVYAVRSTKIFCKPSCPSRRPARRNVTFFASAAAAEAAGYRACLRCRPATTAPDPLALALAAAISYLQQHARHAASSRVTLDSLAAATGVEAAVITRAFDRLLGVTPAQYARSHRLNAFRESLQPAPGRAELPSITEAIYAAGFGSSSRLYEASMAALGMTPSTIRSGGEGASIRYTLCASPLGRTLIAATTIGICAIAFGDSDEQLRAELTDRFPKAGRRQIHDPAAAALERRTGELDEAAAGADDEADRWLVEGTRFVLAAMSEHPLARGFPLDVRATAFQLRIWQALETIPRGETRSYTLLAEQIGQPAAARAVAAACAANPVAVAIPCHRIVASDGAMAGYRWGVERKRTLLEREQERTGNEETIPISVLPPQGSGRGRRKLG